MHRNARVFAPTRRELLMSAGAGAASLALPGIGHAQGGDELVVANWGGDWNSNVMKALETPMLESKGMVIRRDLASAPARKTKLLAERALPRGTVDVAHFTDADAAELQTQNALEELDFSRLEQRHLVSGPRNKFFLPWVYSGVVLIYNPNRIKTPPTSFADLMRPEYAGRVGLIDQIYFNYLYAFSLVAGGTMKNIEPAFPKLLEMKKAVQPRIYPSHQQLAAAMAADEVWISANYKARGAQWQADGLPVRSAYPREGAIAIEFGVVIPKRAKNKDGAYRYLNGMITPEATARLAELTYYAPATAGTKLSTELQQRVEFSEDQRQRLNYVNYAYAAENQSRWLEWWNREIKG